jgi:hypothetical protein
MATGYNSDPLCCCQTKRLPGISCVTERRLLYSLFDKFCMTHVETQFRLHFGSVYYQPIHGVLHVNPAFKKIKDLNIQCYVLSLDLYGFDTSLWIHNL